MKILMLCPMLSGSSFVTSYLFSRMLEPEHTVKFIGPTFGKTLFVSDEKMDIEFIEPLIRTPHGIGILTLIQKNLKRLEMRDYDVVHAFKLLPHTAPVAAIAKRITKKPLVITIDDYDYASPENIFKRIMLKLSEVSYKSADKVITVSRGLQRLYGGELIRQVANEKICNVGRAAREQIRKKLGIEDKIMIVHIGTSYRNKGIHVLIKAVQKLKNKSIRLCVFSVGDDDYIRYLRQIAREETIFLNKIPFQEVPNYTAAADIYVIPTLSTPYTDVQTPAKIFEAMIMKRAIIASDISDNSEFLDGGKCGLLCSPDDVDSLAEKIDELIRDENLRKTLGIRAIKRYFREYSQEIMSKKLKILYKELA